MSSFCIKTNNDKFIDYFFNNISKIISDDIFIKKKKFKIYDNIFIHYKGNNINTFYEKLSNYITESIINTYENENSIDIYVTYEVLETIGTNEKIVF